MHKKNQRSLGPLEFCHRNLHRDSSPIIRLTNLGLPPAHTSPQAYTSHLLLLSIIERQSALQAISILFPKFSTTVCLSKQSLLQRDIKVPQPVEAIIATSPVDPSSPNLPPTTCKTLRTRTALHAHLAWHPVSNRSSASGLCLRTHAFSKWNDRAKWGQHVPNRHRIENHSWSAWQFQGRSFLAHACYAQSGRSA